MTPTHTAHLTVAHPSVGIAPAGFQRVHVELRPTELGRIIGYDPRVLIMKPSRAKSARGTRDVTPHNVSTKIFDLQNRVQRSIDNTRVSRMVEYLVSAIERDTFADWGAVELVTSSEPDFTDFDARAVVHLDADADYFIADGQHRYCALLDFVREYPQYGERFTQSITVSVIPEARLTEWAGQAFHDRNYFPVVVRPGKALSVDSREPLTLLTRELEQHPVIIAAGGIASERDTIRSVDPRFTTLSVLHRFVRGFIAGRPGLDRSYDPRQEISEDMHAKLSDYLARLAAVMPWDASLPGREELLSRTSVVFGALAVVGYDLYNADGLDDEAIDVAIQKLTAINWHRGNLKLVGIVGTEKVIPAKEGKDGEPGTPEQHVVSPASNRQAMDATLRYLREVTGVGAR